MLINYNYKYTLIYIYLKYYIIVQLFDKYDEAYDLKPDNVGFIFELFDGGGCTIFDNIWRNLKYKFDINLGKYLFDIIFWQEKLK